MNLLVFGFGYVAQHLSVRLAQQNVDIVGTTRNPEKINQNHSSAVKLIDLFDPQMEKYINNATHILISIPPIESGDGVLSYYADLIQKAVNIQWIGYLSSTGVYGDHEGQWVDELSLCAPRSSAGIVRLQAEHAWFAFSRQYKLPLHVFRLAGIYGPGRNAIERIKGGKQYSIYKENHVFSRIHVTDIVSVLIASIEHPRPFSIYNLADDEPAASHTVDEYAATMLHQPPLPLMDIDKVTLSMMEKEFYSSNRRISNLKIKSELGVHLQYPSFREGLKNHC